VRGKDMISRLKCKHLKSHFMGFCNCRNEICRCDDVNIYGSGKVKFSSACITNQNSSLPGSNALLRKLKRLSFPSAV